MTDEHYSLTDETQPLHLPTYFDFVAATPMHPKVREVMQPFFIEKFYNPSALYAGAREVKADLDQARSDIAQSLCVKPSEIVFTAGGSESIALALHGVMSRPEHADSSVLISSIEHDALRRSAQQYRLETVGVDHQGMVMLDELRAMLESDMSIALVSIMYVNNEVGTIQPIQEISTIIREVNKARRMQGLSDVLLHTDASQAPLYIDCQPSRLGVDLMTINGGKMYGPKQSGLLYVRSGVELVPLIRGGGQEFGLRSGTENVAFAVGLAKAIQLAVKGRDERAKYVSETRDYCIEKLEELGSVLHGHRTKRIANSVLVSFNGADNEELLIKLDTAGYAVAIGSACHASSGEPSHVLRAMGLDDDVAQSTLRISINEFTTHNDCDRLISAIKNCL